MADEIEREGSCLCGAVQVTVNAGAGIGACHCTMCRTWGGGPLFAAECENSVQWEGENQIAVFESSDWAERGFCRTCGTHLFYRLKETGHYAIPVGLLGDEGPWRFDQQIFIDEKPSYYAFADQATSLTGAEVFAQFTGPS